MHTLTTLLADYFNELPEIKIQALQLDSRRVEPGTLFIALDGHQADGRQYIQEAINKGAAAILQTGHVKDQSIENGIPLLTLPHLDQAIGFIAARFFNQPSQKMRVIGVTGTNGKTSVCYLLAEALEALNYRVAIIGTLGAGLLNALDNTGMTTPDALTLQRLMAQFRQQHIDIVVMEVSSHALAQYRVNGLQFDTAIFTNLTRDHLDYHQTMEAYAASKRRLFDWPGLRCAVINIDDPIGLTWATTMPSSALQTCGYSVSAQNSNADNIFASTITLDRKGLVAEIHTPFGHGQLQAGLLGLFNTSNLLAVLTTLCLLDIKLETALAVLKNATGVPGRMQVIRQDNKPLVVIDYAHTPDALEKVFQTLRAIQAKKIISVFGCGGDRDRGKRPLMAEVVARYADQIIITSDNPRTEDPQAIIAEILQGLPQTSMAIIKPDRCEAINTAIAIAEIDDIVLIAGKGHETVQIIGENNYPFSDVAEAKQALDKLKSIK